MSKYPLKKIDPPEPTRQAALVMTLSLFIMLLSFFLMMNASSDFEESRVEQVLKSIEETFTPRAFRDNTGPSLRPDAENLYGEGQALEAMDAYFRSTFPGFQPQLIPSRGMLSIELKQDEFDKTFFSDRAGQQKTLIEKMWSYDFLQMEIWLNIQNDPGKTSPEAAAELRALVAKTSSWAATLEKEGVEKGRMTIGIKQGKSGYVTVLFRNYKPYAPTP